MKKFNSPRPDTNIKFQQHRDIKIRKNRLRKLFNWKHELRDLEIYAELNGNKIRIESKNGTS